MQDNLRDINRKYDSYMGKRQNLLSLWQHIAEQFYPQRADFTIKRNIGDELSDHLTTSYPIIACRSLQESISTMLRPNGVYWFASTVRGKDKTSHQEAIWLERSTKTQWKAMYDRESMFIKATKQADSDFAPFGQAVISLDVDFSRTRLLYKAWHLKDVAWREGYDGQIDAVFCRYGQESSTIARVFSDTVGPRLKDMAQRMPMENVELRRVVLPLDEYDENKAKKNPNANFVSIIYTMEPEQVVLEELFLKTNPFVIPRWQTVSGSQYAYSPATVAALPDARLIQEMTLTLLESGQKAVDPPMLAVQEAIKSSVDIFAGGITWVDAEYDERLGEVLRPINQDRSGLPAGFNMREDIRSSIFEAFYLNKIQLPPAGGGMSPLEVSQRIQEYVRGALPLFEPLETEYNAALCELTFETLFDVGAFGPVSEIPPGLRGQEVGFKFESPLSESVDKVQAQTFLQTKALLAEAAALDPRAPGMLNVKEALRDALKGQGTPNTWLYSEDEVATIEQQQAQAQQAQQLLEVMGQSADVAARVGEATQKIGI